MKTNKTLHIRDCYFNLPNDFDGSLGDMLMLMATRAKAAEAYREATSTYLPLCTDMLQYLRDKDKLKCVIEYEVLDT